MPSTRQQVCLGVIYRSGKLSFIYLLFFKFLGAYCLTAALNSCAVVIAVSYKQNRREKKDVERWRKPSASIPSFDLARLSPGERVPGVVHDAVKVIDFSQRVHLPGLHLQKVVLLSCEWRRTRSPGKIRGRSCNRKRQRRSNATKHAAKICRIWRSDVFPAQSSPRSDKPSSRTWLNVVPDDADVLVAVGSRVFVPESNHVTQFVHHNAKLVTVFPNWYGLGSASSPSDIGAASAHQRRQKLVSRCVLSLKRQR